MTDLFDPYAGSDAVRPAEPPPIGPVDEPPTLRWCQREGCNNPLPIGAHPGRKYCDEHFIGRTSGSKKRRSGSTRKTRKDAAPPSIKIDLGSTPKTTSKDKQLAQVEARAKQLAQSIAAVLVLSGNSEDAADIVRGTDDLGVAVRDLAEYEPWLRKLAMGGEVSGRAMAWLKLALAVTPIALPIAIRHELLPKDISEKAAEILNMAKVETSPADDDAEATGDVGDQAA